MTSPPPGLEKVPVIQYQVSGGLSYKLKSNKKENWKGWDPLLVALGTYTKERRFQDQFLIGGRALGSVL